MPTVQYFPIPLPSGGTAHFNALDTTGMSASARDTALNNARSANLPSPTPLTFKKFEVNTGKDIQDWCETTYPGLWPLISVYWYMIVQAINIANTFVWLDLTP